MSEKNGILCLKPLKVVRRKMGVQNHRRFYETGASRSLSVRRKALKRLEVAIRCNEKWIRQALWADLNKSDTEAYMMEIGQVLSEISYALRHMKEWSRVEKVHTSMAQKPGRAYKKPHGDGEEKAGATEKNGP